MIVTLERLQRGGASISDCVKFHRFFGSQVDLTTALAVQHAWDFEWGYWGRILLPEAARRAFEAEMTRHRTVRETGLATRLGADDPTYEVRTAVENLYWENAARAFVTAWEGAEALAEAERVEDAAFYRSIT